MRLVDDEQADALDERRQHPLAELRVVEALGADEQQVDLVGVELRRATSSQSSRLVELTVTARMPSRSAAAIWLRMSASSGLIRTVGPARRRRSSAVARK